MVRVRGGDQYGGPKGGGRYGNGRCGNAELNNTDAGAEPEPERAAAAAPLAARTPEKHARSTTTRRLRPGIGQEHGTSTKHQRTRQIARAAASQSQRACERLQARTKPDAAAPPPAVRQARLRRTTSGFAPHLELLNIWIFSPPRHRAPYPPLRVRSRSTLRRCLQEDPCCEDPGRERFTAAALL